MHTQTLCAQCLLLEGIKRPLDAKLESNTHGVVLGYVCPVHREQSTLVCSDAAFFTRIHDFSSDIEDLKTSTSSAPLIVEVDCLINGGIIPIDVVISQFSKFSGSTEFDSVLKLNGGTLVTLDQVLGFNELVLCVEQALSAVSIVVELQFDRLMDLCRLKNSCFFKARVYPSVVYYLKKGGEAQCNEELSLLVESLKRFKALQFSIHLLVDFPYPSLDLLMEFLKRQVGVARALIVSRQRSIRHLLESFSSSASLDLDTTFSADPILVLEEIERCESVQVSRNDFFPLSSAAVIGPALKLLGYGNFSLSTAEQCVLVCPIINTEVHRFRPLEQILNVRKFLAEVASSLNKFFFKSGDERLSTWKHFFAARKVQKALDKNTVKRFRDFSPNLAALFSSPSKMESVERFAKNLQLIVIHNQMDLGCIDMSRRNKCTNIKASVLSDSEPASCCLNCL